ncbi:MAG: hypothetical protein CO119_05145 [Flavobacteriales bacterium CG_4_9_14_3_um_filter_40_17]|nr:MAG: hypothetical protein CO119_05145 [Flavobacteriales bacterium CG_4_9_14_3_um_filter_40_17]
MRKIFFYCLGLFFFANCSSGDDSPKLSGEKAIISFLLQIDGQNKSAIINQQNREITFDLVDVQNLESLTPAIQFSDKATIQPLPNVPQNFNFPVNYKVTAEDGTQAVYEVKVSNKSSENKILSFKVSNGIKTIDAEIDEVSRTIILTTPGIDLTSLVPEITISAKSSVSPASGISQNFNNEIIYTVTSETGTPATYKVLTNQPEFIGVGLTIFSQSLRFFANADLTISSYYMNPNDQDTELFLESGSTKFPLIIDQVDVKDVVVFEPVDGTVIEEKVQSVINARIPQGIITNQNYKLVFTKGNKRILFDKDIDIKVENSPKLLSLDKPVYRLFDVLTLTGENLINTTVIPANALIFVCNADCGPGVSVIVNSNKTELIFNKLSNGSMFPSYLGRPDPVETKLFLIDFEGRISESLPLTLY